MSLSCHHVLHTSRAHMLGRHPLMWVMIRVKVFFVIASSTQKLYEFLIATRYSKTFKTLFLYPQCFFEIIKWAPSVSYPNMGTKFPKLICNTLSPPTECPHSMLLFWTGPAYMPPDHRHPFQGFELRGCDSFVIAIRWWLESNGGCLISEMNASDSCTWPSKLQRVTFQVVSCKHRLWSRIRS